MSATQTAGVPEVDEQPGAKALAEETGLPYQRLVDLFLRDCVVHGRRPSLTWDGAA